MCKFLRINKITICVITRKTDDHIPDLFLGFWRPPTVTSPEVAYGGRTGTDHVFHHVPTNHEPILTELLLDEVLGVLRHDGPRIPDDRVFRLVDPLILVPATITLAGLPLVIDLVHQFLVDHLRGKLLGLATTPCTQRLSQIMTGVQVGQHHRISRTLIGDDHTIFSINRKQIFLRGLLSMDTAGDRSHGPRIRNASGHDLTRGVTRHRVHTELGPLDGLHDPLIELGTS